jgi:putative phosphotransacetylase
MIKNALIPIEVSAKHIHLCQEDLETLFGKGYKLRKLKDLTQPCDFAAHETLGLKVGHNRISNVRIVGPARPKTQIEISFTDAFSLGIMPPLRISGDVKDTPGIIFIGPKGERSIKAGIIIAKRHLHCNYAEAKKLGLKKEKPVSIKIKGERETTFHNIVVRIRKDYKLCLHLDTDEGNAAGILKKGEGILIKS